MPADSMSRQVQSRARALHTAALIAGKQPSVTLHLTQQTRNHHNLKSQEFNSNSRTSRNQITPSCQSNRIPASSSFSVKKRKKVRLTDVNGSVDHLWGGQGRQRKNCTTHFLKNLENYAQLDRGNVQLRHFNILCLMVPIAIILKAWMKGWMNEQMNARMNR